MTAFAAIDFVAAATAYLAMAWAGVLAVAALEDRSARAQARAEKRLSWLTVGLCAAAIVALARSASAAPVNFADHLECRDVEDTAPKQLYTVDLASNELLRQEGCKVRVPAKQVCWATLNDGTFPPSYPGPDGPNLVGRYYLCYEMVCPRDVSQFVLRDKLGGTRLVALRRAKKVCVPGF